MSDTETQPEGIAVTLNGQAIEANPGELLIEAAERNGVDIPRFCYHKRMTSVGMCRMCIVEVDTGRGPSLQPSCMLTCTPGMTVDTESEATKAAQDGVIEALLINHPLDCPICDKGGECPLQDQTMEFGPGESQFLEIKRTYEKPIAISDIVYLDRERCILCDRCTRFADEVAGDALIQFQGRGNHTQVNTFPGEPFSSYFSGNTVQICPVGALTAKPYRFKARPWDLQKTDSTFPNTMGDRIEVHASRDQVLRLMGVDSDATNWGWLSDRDRFSFEALNHEDRLRSPLVRGDSLGNADETGDELVATSWAVALDLAAAALRSGEPNTVGVIGGARLATEDQYAWAKLAKSVIGTDNVDAQLDDGLPAGLISSLPRGTVDGATANGSAVVLLADDPKEQFGTLYLRLRHALRKGDITLVELSPTKSGLAKLSTVHAQPVSGQVGAVATAIVSGMTDQAVGGVQPDTLAAAVAALDGRNVTVIAGRSSLAESAAPTIDAVAALATLPNVAFLFAGRRANLAGAIDMGLAPDVLPGRIGLAEGTARFSEAWGNVPETGGHDTRAMLEAAAAGTMKTLILLGADPLADFPDSDLAARALTAAETVIAVDTLPTASVRVADIVLPAVAFTERDGTHTNFEGRLSPIVRQVGSPGTSRPDWLIAAELALELDDDLGFDSVESIWDEIVATVPLYAGASRELIAEGDGLVVPLQPIDVTAFQAPDVTTVPVLDGYSMRLVTERRLYDNATTTQHCASMAHLGDDAVASLHPLDAAALGVSDGESVAVTSSQSTVQLPVNADNRIPRGVVAIALNRNGADPRHLIDHDAVVTDVRVATP